MTMRQILVAATASLVMASPAFAVTGSYTEASMWGDLAADVAAYAQQSFPSTTAGVILATDEGIYERLAAEQSAAKLTGVAGPSGPIMAAEESRRPRFELRTDASIYERIMAAQRGLIDF